MFGQFVFPHRWPAMNSMTDVDRLAALDVRDQQLEDWLSSRTSSWQCTSTSRPRTPPRGTRIYETDTGAECMWDGSGWVIMSEPLRTWTPTVSGITVGNGFWNWADYHRGDGYCDFSARFITGTTTAITSRVIFTLPIAAARPTQTNQFGCGFYDNGGSWYDGMADLTGNTTQVYLDAVNTAGTYALMNILTPTVPFNWGVGSGHAIDISGRYRMSSRYS